MDNLERILGAWLHQDWQLDFDDWRSANRAGARAQPALQVQKAVSELEGLLATEMSETELSGLLERFGCEFDPTASGLTYRAWLTEVREVLVAP